jgi:hypothetical protein
MTKPATATPCSFRPPQPENEMHMTVEPLRQAAERNILSARPFPI